MMPPNPQRPPSPPIGAGMPNRADQLRMGAEQTLPPPPAPRRPPPGAGGPPPGGIASLMGGGPKPPMGGPPPSPMGGAEEAMGMLGAAGGEGEPAKEEIALGLAVTVNEVTGGNIEEALNMLADAGDLLMQMQGEGGGGPPPSPMGGGEPNRLMELGLV